MIRKVPCDAIVTSARHGRDLRTLVSGRVPHTPPDPEVMPRMRLLPAAAVLLAATALPLVLAACTAGAPPLPAAPASRPPAAPPPAGPDAGLLTGTQLRGLLEPRSYFPHGYVRNPAGTRDTGPGYQPPGNAGLTRPK